jgi:hypothetical protein
MRLLLSVVSVSAVLASVDVPTPKFQLSDAPVKFKRLGPLPENAGSVYADLVGPHYSLKMMAESRSESCGDEYMGFRSLPKTKTLALLQEVEYEVCKQPPMTTDPEQLPQAVLDKYEIETEVTCDEKKAYIRLDCKISSDDADDFVVSRYAKKPRAPLLQGSNKPDSSYFKDRIQCGKWKEAIDNQIRECQQLLINFLTIEKAACKLDRAACNAGGALRSGKKSKLADQDPTTKTDDDPDAAMSPTTIGLIVGGCILVIGGAFAAYKIMGSDDKKKSPAMRRKGNKDARRRAPRDGEDAVSDGPEPLSDNEQERRPLRRQKQHG